MKGAHRLVGHQGGVVRGGRRSKFGAVRTEVDGLTFASKAEARRYSELKLLWDVGEITGQLVLQPRFPLYVQAFGRFEEPVKVGEYVGDFLYTRPDGEEVLEDVKGMATPLYKLKKRMVEAQYGITVVEIRRRG